MPIIVVALVWAVSIAAAIPLADRLRRDRVGAIILTIGFGPLGLLMLAADTGAAKRL